MDATEYAELAVSRAQRVLVEEDVDSPYGDRVLVAAQVEATAALAAAVDRLAAAVEQVQQ